MSYIVETARSLHEDVEQQIKFAVLELSADLKSRKSILQRNTIVSKRIAYILTNLNQLRDIYNDDDEIFQAQLDPIINLPSEQGMTKFLDAAHHVLNTYKHKQPRTVNFGKDMDSDPFKALVDFDQMFTKTEQTGKYIDLQQFYQKFLKLQIFSIFRHLQQHGCLSYDIGALICTDQNDVTLVPVKNALGNADVVVNGSNVHHNVHLVQQKIDTFLREITTLQQNCSYETFLTLFEDMALLLPYQIKKNLSLGVLQEYYEYIHALSDHLLHFVINVNPLLGTYEDMSAEIQYEFQILLNGGEQEQTQQQEQQNNNNNNNTQNFLTTNALLGWAPGLYKTHVINHRQPCTENPNTELIAQQHEELKQQQEKNSKKKKNAQNAEIVTTSNTALKHVSLSDDYKDYGLILNDDEIYHNFGYTLDLKLDKLLTPDSTTTTTTTDSSSATTPPTTQADPTKFFCEPCNKTFNNQGSYTAHIPGKQHQKALARAAATNTSDTSSNTTTTAATTTATATTTTTQTKPTTKYPPFLINTENEKEKTNQEALLKKICFSEYLLGLCADLLRPVITRTYQREEKRQVQSYNEILLDNMESEDDEEALTPHDATNTNLVANQSVDVQTNNRLLTVDGRTIPTWMYKLHGFNVTYSCEICGGDTFRGDRNYKMHFKDTKHSYMLKILGIENSDMFVDISKIDDAKALHHKLQEQFKNLQQNYEEVEDILGNVNKVGQ